MHAAAVMMMMTKITAALTMYWLATCELWSAFVKGEAGWARPLCTSLQHYLGHIFKGLTTDAQQEVSRSVLARLLFRIEAALSCKRFTALGGLLLDRCIFLLICLLFLKGFFVFISLLFTVHLCDGSLHA
jgi:hypothetical protein